MSKEAFIKQALQEPCEECGVPLEDHSEKGHAFSHAIHTSAVALGRKGGRVSTPAKRRAAKKNGKKGGRPKKAVRS